MIKNGHFNHASLRIIEHADELFKDFRILAIPAASDQQTVDNDVFVHVSRSALFGVHRALRNCGDAFSANTIGSRQNFDAVTQAGDWFTGLSDLANNAAQVTVVANVFRRAAAGNERSGEVVCVEVSKCNVRLQMISRSFLSDVQGTLAFGGISCRTVW